VLAAPGSVALDAMHSVRRRVLDVLVDSDLPMAPRQWRVGPRWPIRPAVQHLENMTALGVF